MIGYLDITMGNYDGQTVWKHRMLFCARTRNKASSPDAMSGPDLWTMAMNSPISVPEVASNIRSIDLANGNLWLHDANMKYQSDELGQDFFVNPMMFSEIGDCGPDNVDFLCIGPSAIRHAPTVDGFQSAIRNHLSAAERLRLLEELTEEEGVSNGFAHTK